MPRTGHASHLLSYIRRAIPIVAFLAEVQITIAGDTTRYTLPSGKVFIMRETYLFAESEREASQAV